MRVSLPLFALATLLLTACQSRPPDDWIPHGTGSMQVAPAFRSAELTQVRRLTILPVFADPRVTDREKEVVRNALQRSFQSANLFEVVAISPDEIRRRYGVTAFSPANPLPPDLFDFIREHTAADAILFVEITSISSYPPLALGLKARIESLQREQTTLWAFDQFFNANDPSVALAAKRFNEPGDPNRGSIQLSPSLFAEFVTTVMADSLSPQRRR